MCHSRIRVEFTDNYRIYLFLQRDQCIIYNMEPKIRTVRFMDLLDLKVYKQGKLYENRFIRWNENTELSIDEILTDCSCRRTLLKNGRTQEKLCKIVFYINK